MSRRNGVIQPPGKSGFAWRYHQYTLLTRKVGENGEEEWEEDLASPILFHVQPPDSKPHAPKSALQTGTKAAAAIARTDPVRLPNSLPSYGACLPNPLCHYFRTTGITDHHARCGPAATQIIAGELLEGASVNTRLAQAIPTFTSEIMESLVCAHVLQSFCEHAALCRYICVDNCCCIPDGCLMPRVDVPVPQPSLRSSAPSRKRQTPTPPVVQAVKRSTSVAVGTAAAEARVVPIVNTVVVSAVATGASHPQQSSEPTSLQDAVKYLVGPYLELLFAYLHCMHGMT